MIDIKIKKYYRNRIYSVLFGIVSLLNLIPFIFFLIMESPAGVTNLALSILFFFLFTRKNSPILTISDEALIYQASALGEPITLPYSTMEESLISKGKIVIKIKGRDKPVSINLSNFNKSDRNGVVDSINNMASTLPI